MYLNALAEYNFKRKILDYFYTKLKRKEQITISIYII